VYYYIVAALPYLDFSNPVDTDEESFLDFTRSMLNEKDFAVLDAVRQGDPSAHPFLAAALDFRAELASELARNRAAALGKDAGQYRSASNARMADKARQLVGMENPFEAEVALMSYIWEYLDDLEAGHFFDLQRLVVYLLKLELLQRKNALTEERGTARYAETYQKITQPLEDAEIGV
jgi:Protein of unknown function (DUF2764)